MIINTCKKCSKDFKVSPSRTKRKFCSHKCYWTSLVGRKLPEETKRLLSEVHKGGKNHFFGKKHSEKTLEVLRKANLGKRMSIKTEFKKGTPTWNRGIKSPYPAWNKGKKFPEYSGEKNPNWQGGITPINTAIRNSPEYVDWRIKVFERDDYTCRECGSRGVTLHADHIKPFAYFPELRLVIENGRTLCVPCHKKTDTYGGRAKKIFSGSQGDVT